MNWNYLRRYLDKHRITYQEYLNSPHWIRKRREFWESKLHAGRCCACGDTNRLNVHHKTYENIGHETLEDFCLLCRECHKAAHEIADNARDMILWQCAMIIKRNLQQFGARIPADDAVQAFRMQRTQTKLEARPRKKKR